MEYGSEREHEEVPFKPTKPHFFKIILEDAIRSEKLVIPKRFATRYGNELLDSVVLRIPGGASWQVALTKSDGDIWLSNGWQEFAKNYNLGHGHLLVFEYELNSCFSVVILDTSATEIDYPCSTINFTDKSNLEGRYNVEDVEEVEEIRTEQPSKEKRAKKDQSQLPCEQPHKRKRKNLSSQVESSSKLHKSVSSIDTSSSRKTSAKTEHLTHEESEEALQRAKAGFKSDNPFFMVVMHPLYLRSCQVNVPFQFAEKYLRQSNVEVTQQEKKSFVEVIFQLEGGQSWIVVLYVVPVLRKAAFSSGWWAFVRDNKVKLGDVIIFELIEAKKLVFNIIISRATEDSKCGVPLGDRSRAGNKNSTRTPTLMGEKRKEALWRANAGLESENPSFTVVMQPKYICQRLHVPYQFANKYLRENHCQVTLQVERGQSWTVSSHVLPHCQKASFDSGWKAFARDNNLKLWDAIVFELIDDRKLVFNVIISRSTEDVDCVAPVGPNRRNQAGVAKNSGRSSSKSKRLKKNARANMQRAVSPNDTSSPCKKNSSGTMKASATEIQQQPCEEKSGGRIAGRKKTLVSEIK